MTGTNCLGRLSPLIARVIDCNLVPSPPASITAHRSLMLIGPYWWSSPNNHESFRTVIPYRLIHRFAEEAWQPGRSNLFDGWRLRLNHRRRGSIRGRESDRASWDQFEIFRPRRRLVVADQR